MTSTISATKAIQPEPLPDDRRTISAIWNDAISQYNKTAAELKETDRADLTTPTYRDLEAIKDFGNKEMQDFTFYVHRGRRRDKVMELFLKSIDLIDAGSKQLVAAASASFPPAVVIGTALSFVLSAFKSQKADFDVVANFFEDMNNFLHRVTIIEERVPKQRAYQNALMDVFTALLALCAIARKYIFKGKFKKWIANARYGEDPDLKAGREQMDTSLSRLQSATEFVLLDNSENILDQQGRSLQKLSQLRGDLLRNAEKQEEIAANQKAMLEDISDDVKAMMKDMKKLLSLQQTSKTGQHQDAILVEKLSGNVVRHFYGSPGVLTSKDLPFPDMLAILANLEKSQVEGTGSWLFEHRTWLDWADWSMNSPALLWLVGRPGIGKTYLSLSIYQQLCRLRNSEHEVCTAYFSCRQFDRTRRHARDILRNCAIQIADQSPAIRQRLEAMWRNYSILARILEDDDARQFIYFKERGFHHDSKDIDIFVYENFHKSSANQLFIIVDGINELQDEERERFYDSVRHVENKELRIKFVVTSDYDVEDKVSSKTIEVSKELVLPDLKKTLWTKINSDDSAYDDLRRLSKYNKQRLARAIEKNADDLLYVDQMLLFLANMTREGHIRDWLEQMPVNTTDLYQVMLQRFQQDLPTESIPALRSIVSWLVACFQPLSLGWLDDLVNFTKTLNGVQALSFILQFFEVEFTSEDTTSRLAMDLTTLFEDPLESTTESSLSNTSFHLQVKNRAVQDFFTNAEQTHDLRTSSSDAHRMVFLDTVNIIIQRRTDDRLLYDYSVQHSLLHWDKVVPEQHTLEEQAEVCRAFALLIRDIRYAEGIVEHSTLPCTLGRILPADWEKKWTIWSNYAVKIPLTLETEEYWKDPKVALYPLLIAFVRYWLQSVDEKRTVNAWSWAKDTESWARGSRFWMEDTDQDFNEAYFGPISSKEPNIARRLVGILGSELDSYARFNLAFILRPSLAIEELHLILNNCQDPALRVRCYVELASIHAGKGKWNDAATSCKSALDNAQIVMRSSASKTGSELYGIGIKPDRQAKETSIRQDMAEGGEIEKQQLILRAKALRIQATAMKSLGMKSEAARSFYEARQLSTDFVPVKELLEELLCFQENPVSMIDTLLSFSSIDRLHFLTSGVHDLTQKVEIPLTRMILPAILKSQKSDGVIKVYRELITALDAEQSGAPIRVDLARILWRLRHDIKDVKSLLNQVLDSTLEERRYALTKREPLEVAQSALWLMTDVLLDQFRNTKKMEDKRRILSEATDLPRRNFLASQPLLTDLVWSPYNIAVAYMLRKIGPMSEYQQLMDLIFKKAVDGLDDETKINDIVYLTSLSKVFMMIPSLRQVGEKIYPAKSKSETDEYFEEDEEYEREKDALGLITSTNFCDGICLPVVVFADSILGSWKPHYKCLICIDSKLCQSCYTTRMQWNADPTTKPATEAEFCCPNGQYLRLPKEGGAAISGTSLRVDEDSDADEKVIPEEIDVEQEYGWRDVRALWEKTWEHLSFGI